MLKGTEDKPKQNRTKTNNKMMFLSLSDIILCLEFNLDVISDKLEWSPVHYLRKGSTVVKRNLLTSLQLFCLLVRRGYRSVQGKTSQSRIEKQKTQSTNRIESGNEPRLH